MGIRNLFAPSREAIWRQLCAEIDARYVDGGWWKGDKVEASHGVWTVTLDTFVVSTGKVIITYTRMRAPYVNPDEFRFTIYRRGLFSDVAKFFGMQDVEIGDEAFDRDFIIKGTHESRLRQLFSNRRIRELVAAQPDLLFGVKDDEGWFGPRFPEKVDELYFTVGGIVTDVNRLKLMYELCAETLDELARMGSADTRAPDLKV